MKIHSFKWMMAGALMVASLAGCGGGGGTTPQASTTTINGTASAGIIYPGTVNVYAVNASGTKGALLGSASTSIDGKYSVSLGAYSGAVAVEASGTYTDEATGHAVTLTTAKPLHAMVDAVDNSTKNNKVVAVTPLTDLAWRKASTNGTAVTPPAAMVTANKLVSDLFKISDIVSIEPVRPDNGSMGSSGSQEAQAYTLALAAISRMASTATGATDNDKLEATLNSMETEVEGAETSGSMSSSMSGSFTTALGAVTLSSDFPSAANQLSAMGKASQTLTLATSGSLPAGVKIYAVEGTISIPANVSLRVESNGKTLDDVFLLAGIAAGMGSNPVANYLAPQQEMNFSIVLNQGIGIGDFATLKYDVATGATVANSDFALVISSVKDSNGADITGVTVILK